MLKKMMIFGLLLMSLTLLVNTGCSKKGEVKTTKAASATE